MFNPFSKKKKPVESASEPKRFFSVALGEKMVQAALWETDQTVRVLAKSEAKDYTNANDLLVKLDGCLQELGTEGEQVHQTLFHLDSSFVSGQELSTDQTQFFEKVVSALQLESLGFVTNTEAVINARLAQNPSLGKQLVVEFTSTKTIFSLYQKKKLIESLEMKAKLPFDEQMKGALVQLAGHLGEDYAHYFETKHDELKPGEKEAESLFVNYISALTSSDDIVTTIEALPADLPVRTEVLGSDILLTYILVPSATIIARTYGWLQEGEDEAEVEEASVPPEEPTTCVSEEEEVPVLSRQKLARANKIEATDFDDDEEVDGKRKPASKPLDPSLVKKISIIAVILGVLVAGVIGFWLYLGSGGVEVILEAKTSSLSQSLEVIIDPEATTADYDQLILPGTIENKTVTHSLTVATTGQKDMGEQAKGRVEIVNKMKIERQLKKGLEIENGTVSFALDEDVTLPAAEENSDGLVFSKKEVGITANTRGVAGNIKKDGTLRVGTYVQEELAARAVADFSGGTEKLVSVFSAEDQTNAAKAAAEELSVEALTQIGSKDGDTYLTPQIGQLKVNETTYSLKVGDEGSQVEVNVTGSVPVIAYKLDELEPLALSSLEKELQAGWSFVGDKPEILSGENEQKTAAGDGKIYLDVDLSRAVVRQIDQAAVVAEIKGKATSWVENYLTSHESVKSHELVWESGLAAKILGKLPQAEDKIHLRVK